MNELLIARQLDRTMLHSFTGPQLVLGFAFAILLWSRLLSAKATVWTCGSWKFIDQILDVGHFEGTWKLFPMQIIPFTVLALEHTSWVIFRTLIGNWVVGWKSFSGQAFCVPSMRSFHWNRFLHALIVRVWHLFEIHTTDVVRIKKFSQRNWWNGSEPLKVSLIMSSLAVKHDVSSVARINF